MGGEIVAVTGSQSPALLSSARRSVLDRATAPQSSALRNPDTRWGSRGDLRPLMGAEVVNPEEAHPIDKATGRVRNPAFLAPEDAPSRARKAVAKGDVIYSCVRPYLLNIAVIEDDIDPTPVASTAFAVLAASGHVVARYLWAVLRSPYFVDCVEDKMRGQAYPAINDSDFAMLPIPLPPIAEQHRIVAKVDELMALCDELEAAQTHREARRGRLRTTSLRNLVAPEEPKGNARFFLRHSARMITRPEHVVGVRQAILDLAMRGRLVPQDPGEEPVENLVARIQNEKGKGKLHSASQ